MSLSEADLRALISEIVATLRPEDTGPRVFNNEDQAPVSLRSGLKDLAGCIEHARAEIAALGPEKAPGHSVACATGELDEIKAASERATGEILDQAERIDDYRKFMTPEVGDNVADAIAKMYQACNFQDLTGQRVSKVITALKHIEMRIVRMQQALDGEVPDPNSGLPKKEYQCVGAPLEGPQMPDVAMTQEQVDALLSGDTE